MKELRPVSVKPSQYELLEKEIIRFMKQFYESIIGEKVSVIRNSVDVLEDAILRGAVYYDHTKEGVSGKFNSRLSRRLKELGAVWDKKHTMWKIPLTALPSNILITIGQKDLENSGKINELLRGLGVDTNKFADAMNMARTREAVDTIMEDVNADVDKTVKHVSTVSASLSDEQKEQVRKKYTENMKLNIKSWADEEIVTLRKKIEKRVNKGLRYESLIDSLKKDFGGSIAHAKFVAEQETHLLLAEVREQKYRKAGLNRYKWKTLNYPVGTDPKNVRPDHAHLDFENSHEIYDWDNPPVVNHKTGKRGHPGQDYRCRCTAIPVID